MWTPLQQRENKGSIMSCFVLLFIYRMIVDLYFDTGTLTENRGAGRDGRGLVEWKQDAIDVTGREAPVCLPTGGKKTFRTANI